MQSIVTAVSRTTEPALRDFLNKSWMLVFVYISLEFWSKLSIFWFCVLGTNLCSILERFVGILNFWDRALWENNLYFGILVNDLQGRPNFYFYQ